MSKLKIALRRAKQHADEDPDDGIVILSRQLLKQRDIVERQEKKLQEVDWEGLAQTDLIHANRDQMLKIHEEAIRRIFSVVGPYKVQNTTSAMGALDTLKIQIIDALSNFHPMHEWGGWPE